MKLKGFGLGLVAALACTSAFAQSGRDHDDKSQGKQVKAKNQAEIDFQNRVIDAAAEYKAGHTDESLKQFEQLYAENNNKRDICSWLGFLYLRTNQPEKAVPVLEKASVLKPDDLEVWNNLGNAYMLTNQPDKAIDAFQKVADGGGPSVFEAQYNIGTIYLERKDYDHAIPMLSKAAQARPDDPFAQNNLGFAYEKGNNGAAAADAYAKASNDKQDSKEFAKNAGFAYYRLGRYADAIPYLERAENLDSSDPQVKLALSNSLLKNNQREAAIKAYEASADSQNDNADFWYNLGVLRNSVKNQTGAEEAYQKCLSIQPSNTDALNNLGILQYYDGHYADAEMTFEKLVGLSSDPQAKLNLGSAACRNHDYAKACSYWKAYLKDKPDNIQIRIDLANALWLDKDYDGSRHEYAEVLHRDSTNGEALNGMGLWYLQNSKLADAKVAFQGSIRSNPNNALAYNNLAVTLERLNQRKQAIALLERAIKMDPQNEQIRSNLKRMKAAG